MTLVEILKVINKTYLDNSEGLLTLEGFYDEITGEPIKKGGDGLAYFIVCELHETYDAEEDACTQLRRADKVLSSASDKLLALSDTCIELRLQLSESPFDIA